MIQKSYLTILFLFVLLPFYSCKMAEVQKQKGIGEIQLFSEAQKALDAKAYVDAIELFEEFIKKNSKSQYYTIALERLGESFEGLLDMEYKRRIENGETEATVRKEFLSRFGHFNCWKNEAGRLTYNLIHYKTILDQYPESPVADEAAYHLIQWEDGYKGLPDGPLRELSLLEEVLEKYPATSLRPMILYQMAYRCHILYEIFSFSPNPDITDPKKAEAYKEKALYLYRLTLDLPEHSNYSNKAWENVNKLQKGERIYHFH